MDYSDSMKARFAFWNVGNVYTHLFGNIQTVNCTNILCHATMVGKYNVLYLSYIYNIRSSEYSMRKSCYHHIDVLTTSFTMQVEFSV